jgi:hypothetical protein
VKITLTWKPKTVQQFMIPGLSIALMILVGCLVMHLVWRSQNARGRHSGEAKRLAELINERTGEFALPMSSQIPSVRLASEIEKNASNQSLLRSLTPLPTLPYSSLNAAATGSLVNINANINTSPLTSASNLLAPPPISALTGQAGSILPSRSNIPAYPFGDSSYPGQIVQPGQVVPAVPVMPTNSYNITFPGAGDDSWRYYGDDSVGNSYYENQVAHSQIMQTIDMTGQLQLGLNRQIATNPYVYEPPKPLELSSEFQATQGLQPAPEEVPVRKLSRRELREKGLLGKMRRRKE